MTPGIYSLVSGLNARWNQQEISAKNISGASVTGYRREVAAFASFDKVLNQTNAEMVGRNNALPLPHLQKTSYDWTSGPPTHTAAPLDAKINGDGFFEIQMETGSRLTRSGHFSVNTDRKLVDESGNPVLGRNGVITIPAGKQAVIREDGSVFADTQNLDTLKVVMPDQLDKLTSEGNTHFNPNDATLTVVQKPTFAAGYLESSNIQIPRELTAMINNQRMFDMLTKAVQTSDESVGRAIQDLSS
jgi:flagellar basal-body rod protein FlgG